MPHQSMDHIIIHKKMAIRNIIHEFWIQKSMAFFLIFKFKKWFCAWCKVMCIYMLLTWHTNNNFPNLWLDLNFQLEEDIYIYIYNCNIYSPNI